MQNVAQKPPEIKADPSAEHIAKALGGSKVGGQWLCKCPSHEDKRPSLSIRDGARGVIINCLAGCDFRTVRDTLRQMGIMPEFRPGSTSAAAAPRPVAVAPSAEDIRRQRIARQMHDWAFPCLHSTPAQRYLEMRGIWEPALHTPMRYARLMHPQTKEENVPCIIIPRHNTQTGAVEGCQRVFLSEDGSKYPRKPFAFPDGSTGLAEAKLSLGIVGNGFAMLHKPTDRIVIAEGMESALSASVLYDRPAWARCGGFPAAMHLPECVRDVLICADNDTPLKNGNPRVTSRQRAERLAAHIGKSGRRCEIVMPEQEGWDANDLLLNATK